MILKKASNQKIRNLYKTFELKKKIFKFLIINFNSNPLLIKKKAKFVYNFLLFQKNQLKFSKTKLKKCCILTNRTHGVFQSYGISRVKMREMLQYGVLNGYSKAVW